MTFVILAVIGTAVSFGSIPGLIASALVPALVFRQPTRFRAGAAASVYYASALWAMVPVARAFLSHDTPSSVPVLMLILAALLLTSPWVVCWSGHRTRTRVVLALLLITVPPLGVIGLASPLLAAGYLFPGTGWMGILGVAILSTEAVVNARRPVLLGLGMAMVVNALFDGELGPPQGWVGITTRFQASKGDLVLAYTQQQQLQRLAIAGAGRVTVFPESVVDEWTTATDEFWADTMEKLRQSSRSIVLGATIPVSTRYLNVLVVRGAESNTFEQRVPVPIGMWQPFTDAGVQMNILSRGTLDLAGERVAVLVCYEQLLVWPMLAASVERPTLLVGVSNLADVPVRFIGDSQQVALRSWARLFSLPLVTAVNSRQ